MVKNMLPAPKSPWIPFLKFLFGGCVAERPAGRALITTMLITIILVRHFDVKLHSIYLVV